MNIAFIDLETGSVDDAWTSGREFIRLAGVAYGDKAPHIYDTEQGMQDMCRWLEHADLIVGHNIVGYDLPLLERLYGFDARKAIENGKVFDTLLAARHAEPPIRGVRYNLNAVAKRNGIDGKLLDDGESALKKLAKEYGGFDRIPLDNQQYRDYLVQDVIATRDVFHALKDCADGYLKREHEVMYRLGFITRIGWRVDSPAITQQLVEQEAEGLTLRTWLQDFYGLPSTGKAPHRSTAGIAALEKAFSDVGVEPIRTKKGALATSGDAMDELISQHRDNPGLLQLAKTLKMLNGIRSTVGTLDRCTRSDGRVHPSVDAGQSTGRISVTEPGLTVMGKRKRAQLMERALMLPDEGDVLICADLSQVDARAMAVLSQDPAYLEALEYGKDLHTETAVKMFGDASKRSEAKAITHGANYGLGYKKLAETLGCDEDEAKRKLVALEIAFPKLDDFKRRVRVEAEATGGLMRSGFGRPMRVEIDRIHTQAPALHGQGLARDIMMQGILRLPWWLVECLRAIVHDEIVVSVPRGRVDEARAALKKALEFELRLSPDTAPVPIFAEVSVPGVDWADCYRDEVPWPEASKEHRMLPYCADPDCTWHESTYDDSHGVGSGEGPTGHLPSKHTPSTRQRTTECLLDTSPTPESSTTDLRVGEAQ